MSGQPHSGSGTPSLEPSSTSWSLCCSGSWRSATTDSLGSLDYFLNGHFGQRLAGHLITHATCCPSNNSSTPPSVLFNPPRPSSFLHLTWASFHYRTVPLAILHDLPTKDRHFGASPPMPPPTQVSTLDPLCSKHHLATPFDPLLFCYRDQLPNTCSRISRACCDQSSQN